MAFASQLAHLENWATVHMPEYDALATGLREAKVSTVFFGDRKEFRFSGYLPRGRNGEKYHFYFYPPQGEGVKITKIEGNLFRTPYRPIITSFNYQGVLSGTVSLQVIEQAGRRYIITDIESSDPDGVRYHGRYYLFTIPSPPPVGLDGGDEDEDMHISFFPVVV